MSDGRILIVAGELSGDLHAAGVVAELKRRAPYLTIEGIGGDRMRQAGVRLHAHVGDLAVVGLVEVVARFPAIRRAYRNMIRCLRERRPDLVILVDFPDFNLRLARRASRLGIPVVYFISPQVWAWRAGRIRSIAKYVRRLLVIFPFEEGFYRERGVEASYVGHPLVDRLSSFPSRDETRSRLEFEGVTPVLGLLPGSRVGELTRHLPLLLRSARQLMKEQPDLRVIIAVADGLPLDLIGSYVSREAITARVVQGRTYEVMAASDLILVASGTATLEAAIIGTPMIIVYRLAWLSWLLGRILIRVPYIGMVNLVAGRRVAPELIQFDATPERIAAEARQLLLSAEDRLLMRQELRQVREQLGPPGALGRTVDAILECLPSGAGEEMAVQSG